MMLFNSIIFNMLLIFHNIHLILFEIENIFFLLTLILNSNYIYF